MHHVGFINYNVSQHLQSRLQVWVKTLRPVHWVGLDSEAKGPTGGGNTGVFCFSFEDPEALAQLMKNMPLTNDGKFLLLESETGDDTNGDGPEDLESEA